MINVKVGSTLIASFNYRTHAETFLQRMSKRCGARIVEEKPVGPRSNCNVTEFSRCGFDDSLLFSGRRIDK